MDLSHWSVTEEKCETKGGGGGGMENGYDAKKSERKARTDIREQMQGYFKPSLSSMF